MMLITLLRVHQHQKHCLQPLSRCLKYLFLKSQRMLQVCCHWPLKVRMQKNDRYVNQEKLEEHEVTAALKELLILGQILEEDEQEFPCSTQPYAPPSQLS